MEALALTFLTKLIERYERQVVILNDCIRSNRTNPESIKYLHNEKQAIRKAITIAYGAMTEISTELLGV